MAARKNRLETMWVELLLLLIGEQVLFHTSANSCWNKEEEKFCWDQQYQSPTYGIGIANKICMYNPSEKAGAEAELINGAAVNLKKV